MAEQRFRTVVLGNFDGLHKGHQQLIQLGRTIADQNHEELAVFTFHPQLQEIFDPTFCYLLTDRQKFQRFQQLQVDLVETVPFEENIAKLSPEAFVHDILIEQLRARHVVVGFNYSFGYRGAGNPEILQQLSSVYGISVTVMDPCYVAGEIVSSTAVRNYLRAGDIEKANQMLGYHYSIRGPVLKGNQIGRTIGFPTANICPAEKVLLPANGVYAALTRIEGRTHPGILNIGLRPTIENSVGINVEVNLFDFDADIYGQEICTELYFFLRKEAKFSGLDQLKAQLKHDKEKTQNLFAKMKIN